MVYTFSGPKGTVVIDAVDYDDTTKPMEFVAAELAQRVDRLEEKGVPCGGIVLDNCTTHVGNQGQRGNGFEQHGALAA